MNSLLRSLSLVVIGSVTLTALPGAERPTVTEVPPGYTPCKIVKQETAIYPTRMLTEGFVRGEAHVIVEVGVDGKVTDTLVVLYTNRPFGDEALRVARTSRYAPGTADGQPFISIVQLQFHFESPHMIATELIGLPNLTPGQPVERFEYYARDLQSLDRRPGLRQTVAPIYPQAWIDAGRKGTIMVSFYIDESGRVRMPIARNAHDDLLATSACAAVKEWLFEPPLHRGKPVLAQVELPIIFDPPPKGAAPNPGI